VRNTNFFPGWTRRWVRWGRATCNWLACSARVEALVPRFSGLIGCPASERAALAQAFVAKAGLNFPTTIMLIEILGADKTLRHRCGWQRLGELPSEATFLRAFAGFAKSPLPSRPHEGLIKATYGDLLICHISRDCTAIEAREKPAAKPKPPLTAKF